MPMAPWQSTSPGSPSGHKMGRASDGAFWMAVVMISVTCSQAEVRESDKLVARDLLKCSSNHSPTSLDDDSLTDTVIRAADPRHLTYSCRSPSARPVRHTVVIASQWPSFYLIRPKPHKFKSKA
ncbi:hypothetical protein PGT21_020360 [Puccinia graminis f. sp. tritici]|uniref:Uncharacterized protein n=1 Tax=Puccinia graminis f. sp. tritici TaxID=56615 RepID=A0A5B0QB32_PUCGR|nr:hypothetical protein PGT21_020360 [Puccinia graminis f. sp. tritici]